MVKNSPSTKTDSPEEIAACLCCSKPECTNCLYWMPKRKGQAGANHYRGGNRIMLLDGDKFYTLFIARKSTDAMGRELGVSPDVIRNRLVSLGINGDPRLRTAISKSRFKELPGADLLFAWGDSNG